MDLGGMGMSKIDYVFVSEGFLIKGKCEIDH